MPKIPVRARKVGVGSLTVPRQSTSPASGVGQGLKRLAPIIADFAKRMQEQHDIATTQSTINDFSRENLTQMQDHLDRKGALAKGSLGEYEQWFNKRAGKISSGLQNGNQQIKFNNYALQMKNNNLKSLAGHQARQHQVHMESVIPGTITTAQKVATMTPFNEDSINTEISNVRAAYANARPGIDNSADMAKAEAGIKMSALAAMTQTNPKAAKKFLEKWKSDLGPSYTKARDIIDKDVLYLDAKEKYPGDFVKQREFALKAKGYSEDVKRTVRNRVNSDKIDADNIENAGIEEKEEEWFGLFNKGELKEESIRNSEIVPNSRKTIWLSKLKNQNKKTKDPAMAENTKVVYGEMLEIVDLHPNSITPSDIYEMVGPNDGGLTGPQAASLVDRLKKNQSGDTKEVVKAAVVSAKTKVKEMFNRGHFGQPRGEEGDTKKAKTIKADIMFNMQEWIDANLDKDPNDWLKSKLDLVAAEEEAMGLNGFWDRVRDITPFVDSRSEALEGITSGENDAELAKRFLRREGYEPADFDDDEIEGILNTIEFNEYKTGVLNPGKKKRGDAIGAPEPDLPEKKPGSGRIKIERPDKKKPK